MVNFHWKVKLHWSQVHLTESDLESLLHTQRQEQQSALTILHRKK